MQGGLGGAVWQLVARQAVHRALPGEVGRQASPLAATTEHPGVGGSGGRGEARRAPLHLAPVPLELRAAVAVARPDTQPTVPALGLAHRWEYGQGWASPWQFGMGEPAGWFLSLQTRSSQTSRVSELPSGKAYPGLHAAWRGGGEGPPCTLRPGGTSASCCLQEHEEASGTLVQERGEQAPPVNAPYGFLLATLCTTLRCICRACCAPPWPNTSLS